MVLLASGDISSKVAPENSTGQLGDMCASSCWIYPRRNPEEAIRLTGIYIPQSVDATPKMLEALTAPGNQLAMSGGDIPSHIFVSDVNQNSWSGNGGNLFREWMFEKGM